MIKFDSRSDISISAFDSVEVEAAKECERSRRFGNPKSYEYCLEKVIEARDWSGSQRSSRVSCPLDINKHRNRGSAHPLRIRNFGM